MSDDWLTTDCRTCDNARRMRLMAEGDRIGGMTTRMIVCMVCGNKRCPKATDCSLDCTGSNEPGQPGSVYA